MSPRRVSDLFDLSGKTALVTGGSRGIGLQIAHALGESGAQIELSSRKAGDLEEATRELKDAGINSSFIAANGSIEEEARSLADEAHERLGGIDILVNNAGAAWGEPAEDHSIEGWDKVMDLNVRGYFILSQQVARRSMIPSEGGRIINISSIAGLRGNSPQMETLALADDGGVILDDRYESWLGTYSARAPWS